MEAGSPVLEFKTLAFWMVSKAGDTNAEALTSAVASKSIERHILHQ